MAARTSDVIVVGGGVYGTSILYHLAAAGIPATLFERDHLAGGPTGRSSANVRLHYFLPELADLARRGVELFGAFEELTGHDAGFRRVGVAYAIGPDQAPAWRDNVARLQAKGFEIELREPTDLVDLAPGYALDGVALCAWEPTTGYADPTGITNGFAARARELGAHVQTGTPVVRLLAEGDRAMGVETADGERHAAGTVVVATGPWTRGLVAPLGVELPLHVERQAITILDAPSGARPVVPTVWGDFVTGFYARPEGDAAILLGDEHAPPPLQDLAAWDQHATLAESTDIIARAASRIPALAGLGIRRGYASLYDVSADRLHIIDWLPGTDGVLVVCGTSGHGFKLAPAMGEQIARMVAGEPTPLLEPFRLARTYDASRERSR
jgi:sarcosine oxidase subunit beta